MAEEKETKDLNAAGENGQTETTVHKSAGNTFLLRERYEINFNTPISWLDANGANAYKVTDRIDPRRELFALVCGTETAPRSSYFAYLKSMDHPNIMKLVEYGSIKHPIKNIRTIALIYATPLGGKVLDSAAEIDYKSTPSKLKPVISGLLAAVEALRGYNITHRAIRPSNIFYKNKEKTEVVVGDCLAGFPAFYQPPAYETAESLMSMPAGRGNGTDKNDIYAVGASCISILLGKELLTDLTLPEILRLKLRKGTYFSLTREEKIPNQYVTIFKGLLSDDISSRWNFVQSYNYFEGKANSFANQATSEKPKRSLSINGEKCYTRAEVALALSTNQDEAFELIKNGKVSEWIKNGLEDEKIFTEIDKLVKQYSDADNREILIAKICILIDHHAPIRIQEISLFPDGSPKAIFYCIKNKIELKSFYDLFNSDLIRMWYFEQENLRSPANAAEFKIYVNRNDLGYGLDRIMYDFDEDLPCISPLIGDEFVNTAPRILKALDNNYPNIKGRAMPYDRNIIAFLRCKMGKKIDGILIDLNTKKEELKISAIIRLYTDMQNKYGPVQLTNLSKWLSNISQPLIKSYHNIKLQKALERELLKVSKEGKLIEICNLLENPEARQKDKDQYLTAVKEIHSLITEKNRLVTGGFKLDEEAVELGNKFSAILAVFTMLTSFVLNIIYWITQ